MCEQSSNRWQSWRRNASHASWRLTSRCISRSCRACTCSWSRWAQRAAWSPRRKYRRCRRCSLRARCRNASRSGSRRRRCRPNSCCARPARAWRWARSWPSSRAAASSTGPSHWPSQSASTTSPRRSTCSLPTRRRCVSSAASPVRARFSILSFPLLASCLLSSRSCPRAPQDAYRFSSSYQHCIALHCCLWHAVLLPPFPFLPCPALPRPALSCAWLWFLPVQQLSYKLNYFSVLYWRGFWFLIDTPPRLLMLISQPLLRALPLPIICALHLFCHVLIVFCVYYRMLIVPCIVFFFNCRSRGRCVQYIVIVKNSFVSLLNFVILCFSFYLFYMYSIYVVCSIILLLEFCFGFFLLYSVFNLTGNCKFF